MSKVSTIVTHSWLAQQIAKGAANITILDATNPLPRSPQKPLKEYKQKHIPGALFFDIDESGPRHSPYAHTLGPKENFEKHVGRLGITNNTHVVLYDNLESVGVFSAPRAWWMFRTFGHKDVSVLEGGLKTWVAEGHDLTAEVPEVEPAKYTATFNPELIVMFEEMCANVKEQKFQVMDARGTGRFEGKVPEPRPGIKSGHICNAVHVHYRTIFQNGSRLFKSPRDLAKLFQDRGIDLSLPLVATCGTGISACHLALAAYLAGKHDVAVFDGSWEEFYSRCKDTHPEYLVTGVDPGHILNSINVPFPNIFQKDSRAFKSAEDMKKMFEEKGLDLSKPIIATCGSGVSACCLAFGAYVAGHENVHVFDGSWEEFFTKNKFKGPELMFSSKPQVNK